MVPHVQYSEGMLLLPVEKNRCWAPSSSHCNLRMNAVLLFTVCWGGFFRHSEILRIEMFKAGSEDLWDRKKKKIIIILNSNYLHVWERWKESIFNTMWTSSILGFSMCPFFFSFFFLSIFYFYGSPVSWVVPNSKLKSFSTPLTQAMQKHCFLWWKTVRGYMSKLTGWVGLSSV